LLDVVAEGFKHASDLSVSAFMNRDPDFGPARAFHELNPIGCSRSVFQFYTRTQGLQLVFRDRLLHTHAIQLFNLKAWMGEAVRERAVIRNEKYARGLPVEASYGKQTGGGQSRVDDQIHYGSSSAFVGNCRDRVVGFVYKDVFEPRRKYSASVYENLNARPDLRTQLRNHAPVDGYGSTCDQLVGLPPGAHARPSDVPIESDFLVS
jgi:hypothetical protein